MLATKAVVKIPDSLKLNSLVDGKSFFRPQWRKNLSLLRPTNMARVNVKVRVSNGGYAKRKMEAPGAYELIDEETGEKVIVWGGSEDSDDVGIPSQHVISWTPTKKEKKKTSSSSERNEGIERGSAIQNKDSQKATPRAVVGGFGKLKSQKMRSLVRKASQEKQDVIERQYEEPVTDDSDDDCGADLEDEFAEEDEDVNVNHVSKQFHKHPIASEKSYKSDASAAVLATSTPSRGWGGGAPKHGFRHELRALKPNWKQTADGGFFSKKSFKEAGSSDAMLVCLKQQQFVRPSHIQAMAFGPVINEKTCIIADQSGSGKTLAYLAPLVQRLREEELQGISKSSPRNPRAVILVPTAELGSQVLRNCRSISRFGVPFRSIIATGGFRQKTQLESLEQDIDVLIATPGRFMYLVKEGFLELTNLRCAVLDEVDILYSDEDFEVAFQNLTSSSLVTTQYLFVTATLPVDIYNKLVEVFPDCEVIMGPGMHRTSSGLEEVLVDCSGGDGTEKTPETAFLNKKSALLKLVKESPVARTIVFCNKIETCRKVENALRRYDRKESRVQVLPFHAALEQEKRVANMRQFLNTEYPEESLFLVCTDRASRGIDFKNVDHVVLFDFPRDPSEYVRRVGRTARGAGGIGKAFVFVVGKQVSLARRIMDRNQKGHPLHEVPSAYELVR